MGEESLRDDELRGTVFSEDTCQARGTWFQGIVLLFLLKMLVSSEEAREEELTLPILRHQEQSRHHFVQSLQVLATSIPEAEDCVMMIALTKMERQKKRMWMVLVSRAK